MLKQIGISVVVLSIGGVGTIFYTWGSWTTQTLIKVDKRTEVMEVKLSAIAERLEEIQIGYIQKSNEKSKLQSHLHGGELMPKDACYHKVKARYKVFPSAYASGAIAKCRKVGAANYGTGGKKKKKRKQLRKLMGVLSLL